MNVHIMTTLCLIVMRGMADNACSTAPSMSGCPQTAIVCHAAPNSCIITILLCTLSLESLNESGLQNPHKVLLKLLHMQYNYECSVGLVPP